MYGHNADVIYSGVYRYARKAYVLIFLFNGYHSNSSFVVQQTAIGLLTSFFFFGKSWVSPISSPHLLSVMKATYLKNIGATLAVDQLGHIDVSTVTNL